MKILTRLAVPCFAAFLLFGCDSGGGSRSHEGGLVVLVESDLSIPKDIDHVTVDVTQSGKTLLHLDRDLGADGLKLPAPLSIAPTGNTRPVTVHGIASKGGTPRIERSAVTPVPETYVGEIHLPFDYLCDGTATADGKSTCPDGQTCKLGTCESTTVPKSELTHASTSGSGDGGTPGGDGGAVGTCFDVVPCMQGQPTITVDATTCTLPVPSGTPADHLNVAIQLSGGDAGICAPDGTACWVVLDEGEEGWSSDGTTITLPPGVCSSGQAPTIAVSNDCHSKQPGTPLCGAWSTSTQPIDRPPPATTGACGQLTRSCGRCGTQTRTCANGVPSEYAACQGEGSCSPEDTQGCATTGAVESCASDCSWGACECPKGTLACDGTCVRDDDVHHCGQCDHDCSGLAHVSGTATCGGGKCAFVASACANGWGDCDGNADNGCETDLTVAAHCGACDTNCSGSKDKCAAAAGEYACVATCPSTAPNECGSSCVDDGSDPNNCGSCGNTCPAAAHAQPSCASGACGTTCNDGYSVCGGTCVDLTSDATHCGSCTNTCSGGKSCTAGQCTCPAGTHDCGGMCASNAATATCGSSCSPCTAPTGGGVRCDGTSCTQTCPSGQMVCGGKCTDLTIDTSHCGSCTNACSGGKTCSAGQCGCPAGTHDCNGICASNTATATCGSSCSPCTAPAGGSVRCDGTKCVPQCPGTESICSNSCVDEQSDSAHCGACNTACASPRTCQAGQCLCPSGEHDCNGACVSNTALVTCGSSCSPCTAPTSGTATCDGTHCGAICNDSSLTLCAQACVNEQKDGNNCGGCNTICSGGKSCVLGTCACPSGQHDCNGICVDSSSVNTCGQSCMACPAPTNGVATCDGTKCGVSCMSSYTACGSACDVTSQSCGTCGTGTQTRTCNPGGTWSPWSSCAGGTDLQTSNAHCGTCTIACANGVTCTAGTCPCSGSSTVACGTCGTGTQTRTCNSDGTWTGYSQCTGGADLQTDNANCGSCGVKCASGFTCTAGACAGNVTAIAAGVYNTCAVVGGAVRCWGDNNKGELGIGSSSGPQTCGQNPTAQVGVLNQCATKPVAVTPVSGTAFGVAVGLESACQLVSGGSTVLCWGDDAFGELGTGSPPTNSSTPVFVANEATALSMANLSACALLMGGTVLCWGTHGTSSSGAQLTPTVVTGLGGNVVAIASGTASNCALNSDGTVECWGANTFGELGNNSTTGSGPVQVSGLNTATAVAVGDKFACALTSDGHVWCWGFNYYGTIGNGVIASTSSNAAVTIPTDTGLTNVTGIAAGGNNACARRSDGSLLCWGDNTFGQVGTNPGGSNSLPQLCGYNDKYACSTTPRRISGVNNVTGIAVGLGFICALQSPGSVFCWGSNQYGQLGNNTTTTSFTPVAVQW